MNAKKRNAKRDAYLRRTYGLTTKQYRLMIYSQGFGCAICGKRPQPGKRLHVDHVHSGPDKGRVRGGLCFFCNYKLLGRGREKASSHETAANYLRSTFDWRKA